MQKIIIKLKMESQWMLRSPYNRESNPSSNVKIDYIYSDMDIIYNNMNILHEKLDILNRNLNVLHAIVADKKPTKRKPKKESNEKTVKKVKLTQ